MGSSLNEKLNPVPKERRQRIFTEADRLHAEYMTLQDIRKAKMLTQVQLVESLNIRQATVAQTEKRSNMLLSTLRNYIEAMGGQLLLTVEFPDRPHVVLKGLSDIEQFSTG
ncbi:MAG: XRE family transcriptional regulator [Gammaproteobacteria bacterium]|nr:XRE family transcriptional regulator [Gammaproteobacteria bacterium]MCY4226185.1 XRE family transcriptional regulator [Gammaproteobacteria bacterium]